MKMYLVIVVALSLLFSSCKSSSDQPDNEELMVMHKLIERSHPDTVGKYLTYYGHKYKLPDAFGNIEDGSYHGASPYDDYDYLHMVDFTIEDGLLTAISYDEVHRDGHSKKSDSTYNAEMNNNVYGSAPAMAYDKYESRLLENQNFTDIDAISGATYSKYRLKYAVWRAVLQGPVKQ